MMAALCFPGQGFQKVGILAGFVRRFPKIVNPILDEIDSIHPKLGLSAALRDENSSLDVTPTSIAQPLILSASFAIFQVFRKSHPELNVKYALGHSLGEYTALTTSGYLTFEQGLKFVRKRGLAMENATLNSHTGMLLVVKPRKNNEGFDDVLKLIVSENNVDIGNINSPLQTVVSGKKTDLENVLAALKKAYPRIITSFLKVSGAFHSRQMAPAQEEVAQEAQRINWQFPARVEVVSNLTALPFQSAQQIQDSCASMLCEPVRWSESMYFVNDKVDEIISLGPGKIAKSMEPELKIGVRYLCEPDDF